MPRFIPPACPRVLRFSTVYRTELQSTMEPHKDSNWITLIQEEIDSRLDQIRQINDSASANHLRMATCANDKTVLILSSRFMPIPNWHTKSTRLMMP